MQQIDREASQRAKPYRKYFGYDSNWSFKQKKSKIEMDKIIFSIVNNY